MTTSMYCLYVGVDYTYIDVNVLAHGIKSFLASQVWFQAVAGARTYGTDSPAITSQPRYVYTYVYTYVWMYVCMDVCMYGCMCALTAGKRLQTLCLLTMIATHMYIFVFNNL